MILSMDKKEIIRRVAETIRIERLRKKLSQQDLAEMVGISTKYLNLIENEKSNPTVVIVVQICLALDINLDKLLKSE